MRDDSDGTLNELSRCVCIDAPCGRVLNRAFAKRSLFGSMCPAWASVPGVFCESVFLASSARSAPDGQPGADRALAVEGNTEVSCGSRGSLAVERRFAMLSGTSRNLIGVLLHQREEATTPRE